MICSLREIEAAISPAEIVEHFKLAYSQDHNGLVVTCPFCASSCWVLRRGVLCQNADCSMIAGSVFELAMGASEVRNFPQTARAVLTKFQRRLATLPGFEESSFVPTVVRALRLRRRMVQLIRDTQAPSQISGVRANLMQQFAKEGIVNPGGSLVSVMSVTQQEAFRALLSDMGLEDPPPFPPTDLLCSFYWSEVHEPAAVVLMNPRHKWQTIIELGSYGLAVCGLHTLTPNVKVAHLHSTPYEAGAKNAEWMRRDLSCASVSYLLGDLQVSPIEQDATIMHWNYELLLPTAGRLRDLHPELKFTLQGQDTHLSYTQLLLHLLLPHVRDGSLSRRGLNVLSQINPDGADRAALIDALRARHLPKAANQITERMYNVVVASADKSTVLSTPAGYVVRKGNKPTEPVSNFTLEPTALVSYGQHRQPMLEVATRIGSGAISSQVHMRLLDSAKDLTDYLSLHLAASGGLVTPVVRDSKAFGLAMQHVKSQAQRVPTKIGLPFLGWTFDRSQFFAPGLMITADSCALRAKLPPYPEAAMFNCYNHEPVAEATDKLAELSTDEQQLVLLLLGALIRASRNEQHHAVTYRHDGLAQTLFERAFAGVGQLHPVQAVQLASDYVHGYPVWTHGYRRDPKSRAAVFTLASAGERVTTSRPHPNLPGIVRRLMRQTVESLMGCAEQDWQSPQGVTYLNILLTEAATFAHKHLDESPTLRVRSYAWLEHALKSVKPDNINRLLHYDFDNQVTRWDLSNLTRSSADVLSFEAELRSLMDGVRVQDGKICTPAAETIDMLSLYYGATPTFEVGAPPQ